MYDVNFQVSLIYVYSDVEISGILSFFCLQLWVVFGDQVFQQPVEILMGTYCVLLYWKIHSYIIFVQTLLWDNKKKKPSHINDVLSINNTNVHNYMLGISQ
jgi:hypothetical protein